MGQLCGCQLTAATLTSTEPELHDESKNRKRSVGHVAAFTADCKPSGVAKQAAVWVQTLQPASHFVYDKVNEGFASQKLA